MRKLIIYLILVLLSYSKLAAQMPQSIAWKINFEGSFKWWNIHDTGVLLLQTSEALYGIDPEKEEIIWFLDNLPSKKEEDFKYMPNTPFVQVITNGIAGNGRDIVFDAYRGIILFDNRESNIKKIEIVHFLPSINRLYIQGLIDKIPAARIINLDNGKGEWEINLATKKSKVSLLFNKLLNIDQEALALKPVADKFGNILIHLPRYKTLLKLDGKTGDIIWEKEIGIFYKFFLTPQKDKLFIISRELQPDFISNLPNPVNQNYGDEIYGTKSTSGETKESKRLSVKKEKTGLLQKLKSKSNNNASSARPREILLLAIDVVSGDVVWNYASHSYFDYITYENELMISPCGKLVFLKYQTGEELASYKLHDEDAIVMPYFFKDEVYIVAVGRFRDDNNNKGATKKVSLFRKTSNKNPKGLFTYVYKFNDKGERLWVSPPIKGYQWKFGEAGHNKLFLMTRKEINLLEAQTGQPLLENPLEIPWYEKKGPDNKTIIEYYDRILLADKLEELIIIYFFGLNKIYTIDTYNGKARLVADEIKFRGGKEERPNSLIPLANGGYLLSSSQNLFAFDKNGKELYDKYYPRPNRFGRALSKFGKNLSGGLINIAAQGVLITDAINNGPITQTQNKFGNYNLDILIAGVEGVLDLNTYANRVNALIRSKYDSLENVTLNNDILIAYKRIKNREIAIFASSRYKYIFSKEENMEGLYQLNIYENKQLTFIPFDDKTPEYEIDYITGDLFFLSNKSEISVFSLAKE